MAEGRADAGPVERLRLEGLATGKCAVEWIGNRVKDVVHGAQQSVTKWNHGIQLMGSKNGSTRVAPKPDENAGQVILTVGQTLEKEMEAWRRNCTWVDQEPVIQVTVPKGTLCQVNSQFKIGIPPDAVYNILIDPGNKRVFKNIQEVKYRKVIEDDGHRQLVEVDQAAIWRFLWFSGTLNVCVLVDQDRRTRFMKYWLARQGFMKQFEGSWKVEPLHVDAQGSPAPERDADRVASIVHLQQVVQPAMLPPPPFKSYVRRITTRTTEMLLLDLQAEGKRLRETTPDTPRDHPDMMEVDQKEQSSDDPLRSHRMSAGSHRKLRKSRWRLKEEASS